MSKLPNIYFYYHLQHKRFQNRVAGYATGTTVLAMPRDTIEKYVLVIPDEETVWLMEEYYRHYFAGNKPRVALNKARNAVRKRLIARDGVDHPFFWAAFVLEGAPPSETPDE